MDKDNRNHTAALEYTVEFFKPEHAQGIGDLFRAVYGEEYPIRVFYSPDELTAANRSGDYISVVACDSDGRVIGVQHIYRSAPNRDLYEWGVGLTIKEYRGHGIFGRLGSFLVEKAVPRFGIPAAFGESVCNHLHTQRMVARNGFFDTAVEIALMPAQTYAKEQSAQGRVATLLQFRTFTKAPHRVYVPQSYHEQLRFAYAELDDEREFAPSDASLTRGRTCRADQKIFDFAKVSRVAFHELGRDFAERVREFEDHARAGGVIVFQTWLPLADPSVGEAVEICRSEGYVYGGPLIRWFGGDGLLMQKPECDPDFERINVHSDRACALLELVREDWERNCRSGR